jgi:hypothetical protein
MMDSRDFSPMSEFGLAGMGIGGGFDSTEELHLLTYEQAMQSPKHREWNDAVSQEHDRMLQHGVFVPVLIADLPSNDKTTTSTWAMKQKADWTKRARLAAHCFKQVPGIHYDPDTRSSPVVCDATIRMMFVLAIMAGHPIHVVDVQGAFLNGEF